MKYLLIRLSWCLLSQVSILWECEWKISEQFISWWPWTSVYSECIIITSLCSPLHWPDNIYLLQPWSQLLVTVCPRVTHHCNTFFRWAQHHCDTGHTITIIIISASSICTFKASAIFKISLKIFILLWRHIFLFLFVTIIYKTILKLNQNVSGLDICECYLWIWIQKMLKDFCLIVSTPDTHKLAQKCHIEDRSKIKTPLKTRMENEK